MGRVRNALLAVGGATIVVTAVPGAAFAQSLPVVESELVSKVTQNDATLEARIGTEGVENGAWYQFQLVTNTNEYQAEFTCPSEGFPHGSSLCLGIASQPGALPISFLEASLTGQLITLNLAKAGITLAPGTSYHYRVIAARRIPEVDVIRWESPIVHAPDQTFTTPSALAPPGVSTTGASATSPTTAVVDGSAEPKGQSTTVHADYALASEPWCTSHGSEGSPAETSPQSIDSINGVVSGIVVNLEALTPGREYCAELVAHNESGTSSGRQVLLTTRPLIETAEYKNWVLSGTLTDKRLGQTITLPEGSTFDGSGEVNVETGAGSIVGNIFVPPFAAVLNPFGQINVSIGMTLTQVGAIEGVVATSETVSGHETLTMPVKLNLGITSVGRRGRTIPTRCTTSEPVALNFVDTLTRAELLRKGWSSTGTATLPAIRCEGKGRGVTLGHTLTRLLSGPENPYSITIRAPGAS
jgi:hypothetical protein